MQTMIVGEGQGFDETADDASCRRHRRGVRPGRQRVQHLQYRPPVVRAADRREDAGPAEREEIADLFRQRPAAERPGQPGAVARHHQRRHPRRRVVLADRRARPGGRGSAGRRHAGIAGRHRHVYRRFRAGRQSPTFSGRRTRFRRWPRDTGGKALLDYNDLAAGIVQAQKAVSSYYIIGYYTANTTLDGKFRRIKISLNDGLTAKLDYPPGLLTPASSSPSSPPPTRNGSSKTR